MAVAQEEGNLLAVSISGNVNLLFHKVTWYLNDARSLFCVQQRCRYEKVFGGNEKLTRRNEKLLGLNENLPG